MLVMAVHCRVPRAPTPPLALSRGSADLPVLGLSGVMAASIFALKSPWQQNYSVKLTRRSDGHVLKPYAKCRLTPSKGIGSLDLRRMSMSPQPYLRPYE